MLYVVVDRERDVSGSVLRTEDVGEVAELLPIGLGRELVVVLVLDAGGAVVAREVSGDVGIDDWVGIGTRAARRPVGRFDGLGDGNSVGSQDAAALAFEVLGRLAHVDGVLVQPLRAEQLQVVELREHRGVQHEERYAETRDGPVHVTGTMVDTSAVTFSWCRLVSSETRISRANNM